MHLHATLNLAPILHPSSEVETELDSSSREEQPRGQTEPSELSLLSVSNLTLEIFTGVTLWLDILSCASTGLGPRHSQLCIAALTEENSKIQLQDLMGCENWAMLLIREIAILKVSRDQASNQQNQEDLQRRAADIEQRLEGGLRKAAKPYVELTEYSESARTTEMSRQIEIKGITQVMALAALIYLHVSVHGSGPQSLPVASELLFRWMFNIRFMPDSRIVPYLVWPICIAGCMATTPLQEQFFRDIVADAVADENSNGTWLYVLQVMELCWKMRRIEGNDSEGWDWERAMRVQGRIVLLV
jgi:C6 transcription factor Pro1